MVHFLVFPCKIYGTEADVCTPTANPYVDVYCMLLCTKYFSFIRNYLSSVVYLFVIFSIVGFLSCFYLA